jgi:hypothetical protein
MYYYMIDLIQFPSPHVPKEDYSHMMMRDENMAVEIIVASMVMMLAKKFPLPRVEREKNVIPNPCFRFR